MTNSRAMTQRRPPARQQARGSRENRSNPKKTWQLWLALGIAVLVLVLLALVGYPYLKKMAYPLKYQDSISQYAKENGLDPYLVCGVIHTESRFDNEAESRVGAVGLMQIMPDTGQWIAQKMPLEGYEEAKLKDPETNIRMGCWYLRYLMDRFDGDLTLVLAGYNAGPNRVTQWLADPQHSQNGTLTNIPYEETENYVKKVQNAKEMYEAYYTLP